MCEALAFHHAPRWLQALIHALFSLIPNCIRRLARVKGRFHCRQSTLRRRRLNQPSSFCKTFFTPISRKSFIQPRSFGFSSATVRLSEQPRPRRSTALTSPSKRLMALPAIFSRMLYFLEHRLYPRNVLDQGRPTPLFSRLTFSLSLLSRNPVTEFSTRSPAL